VTDGTRHRSLFSKSIGLCAIFFALCSAAAAQQPTKVYKVGRLTGGSANDPFYRESFEAFRQGLRELGWTEGQNILLESRWTGERPESLCHLAAELVKLPVDVLVANGATMVQAAQAATTTIPIVMAASGADPVAAGFVTSLARPGGNITGLTLLSATLDGKRLELLREVVPGVGHVAVLQIRIFQKQQLDGETQKLRPNRYVSDFNPGMFGVQSKSRWHSLPQRTRKLC
jgi:putative tryptophan/tyrosine transport system substrate-binding protein